MQKTLWLILGLYAVLAIACSAVNPLFEAPDEHHHYYTAWHIAKTGKLPQADAGALARQEAAQPPLYYLVSAAIIAPLDSSSAEPALWYNPYARLGHFGSVINVNAFVHGPQEAWPWRDAALAAHLVRLLSVVLGLGTLLCIYASARLLWPANVERALLATALVAFLPQFIFLHAAVTNDVLIILLCSAALWQFLRLWLDGVTNGRLLALGVTIGLASLTKTTGLLLLVLAGIMALMLAWRTRRWDMLVRFALLVGVPVLVMAGGIFWRNWTLYGDPLAVNAFVELADGGRQLTALQVLSDFDRVWQSSIAVFGWMNLTGPMWVFAIWNGLVALGLAGIVLGGLRTLWTRLAKRSETQAGAGTSTGPIPWFSAILLAVWVLLVFAAWLQFAMRTPADQGRLLFPAILPVALTLAYGLSQWGRRWVYPVASLLALITAVYCIAYLLPTTYAPPALLDEANIPAEAGRIDQDMGMGLVLVAGEVHTTSAQPGDAVDLTLYWRTEGITTTPAIIQPEILGRGHVQVGRLPEGYHGGGLYPSTLWPLDAIIREEVRIKLDDDIEAPTEGRLAVHLEGQEAFALAGSLKVEPHTWPETSETISAQLGAGIAIVEAGLGTTNVNQGATVPVAIRWQVSEAPGKPLTTFVHMGEPSSPPLAQADSPALGGDYPATLWDAGEVFDDQYLLRLPEGIPAGRYAVHVGLYDPNTGQRLPLWVQGERQANDSLLVGWVVVEPPE